MAREYIELYGIAGNQTPGGEASTIDLRRLFADIRKRSGWVVLCALLGLAGAVAVIALVPARYVATAQLIIDPRGLKVLDTDVNPSVQSADAVVGVVESELRVIKSTKVFDRVIDTMKLTEDSEFNGTRISPIGRVVKSAKAVVAALLGTTKPDGDLRTKVRTTLDERVGAIRSERSFVIDVAVTSEDPAKAARIANALADAYVSVSVEAQAEIARRSGGAIAGNLEQMQSRVREAENAVEVFKTRNNLIGAGGRLVSDQQLADLNTQLSRARTQVVEARAKIDQITRMQSNGEGAFAEAVQSQTVMALRVQLADIKRRYANLETKLGSRHPELAEVRRELSEAQAGISAEIGRLSQAARMDYERSREAERNLEANLDQQSRTAVGASKAFVQLRELERATEASRSVYNAALVRNRQLQEQALLDTTNVRQITIATAPEKQAGAPALLILALGLVVGGTVGAGGVLAARAIDARVRSRTDLEQASGLSVLKMLPSGPAKGAAFSLKSPPPEPLAFLGLIDALNAGSGQAAPQAVGVASVEVDGASHTAFYLACAAAGIGAQVLLIDAAIDGRRLTGTLGCEGQRGVGACAGGGVRLHDAVVALPGTGIDFLPADAEAAQELRRLGGAGMPGIVRDALAEYTLVVLDLGCAVREPLARTAGAADAGILVIEEERSLYPQVQGAIAACRGAKLRMTGLVLAAKQFRPS